MVDEKSHSDKILRFELDQILQKIGKQDKLFEAITELTIEMKMMNVTLKNTIESQKQLTFDLKRHVEQSEKRFHDLEILPGQQLLESKKHIVRNVITAAITSAVIFIVSLFAGMVIEYKVNKDHAEQYQNNAITKK